MWTKTAVGTAPGRVSIWQYASEGLEWPKRPARYPAVFPPNLATGIPIDWKTEIPDPRDDPEEDARWGYPIRVHLIPKGICRGPWPEVSKVSLRPLSGGNEVPVQILSSPKNFKLMGESVPTCVLPRWPQAIRAPQRPPPRGSTAADR